MPELDCFHLLNRFLNKVQDSISPQNNLNWVCLLSGYIIVFATLDLKGFDRSVTNTKDYLVLFRQQFLSRNA